MEQQENKDAAANRISGGKRYCDNIIDNKNINKNTANKDNMPREEGNNYSGMKINRTGRYKIMQWVQISYATL